MTTTGRRLKTRTSDEANRTSHEANYWRMPEAPRGSMDAAENRDEYIVENIFRPASGAPPQEYDGKPFEEKMSQLSAQAQEQQAEVQQLGNRVEINLERLGFGAQRIGDAQD